jgi:hypothetical protein
MKCVHADEWCNLILVGFIPLDRILAGPNSRSECSSGDKQYSVVCTEYWLPAIHSISSSLSVAYRTFCQKAPYSFWRISGTEAAEFPVQYNSWSPLSYKWTATVLCILYRSLNRNFKLKLCVKYLAYWLYLEMKRNELINTKQSVAITWITEKAKTTKQTTRCLLNCDAVQCSGKISTFRRTTLRPYSTWRQRQHGISKLWSPNRTQHGVTLQKTSSWIFTVVKTSNFQTK